MSNNIFFERGQMAVKPNNYLWNGDCLELMKDIPDKSMDAIICDLPYGTTACKWDVVIPFDLLWKQYNRIIKDDGIIVLFGTQPFTSQLVNSNLKNFKQELIWDKIMPVGHLIAKKRIMQVHENILLFWKKQPTFNRQFTERPLKDQRKNIVKNNLKREDTKISELVKNSPENRFADDYDNTKVNPKSIISITKRIPTKERLHPTQKNHLLIEYLVKTYTNENDWVLDNTCGSNTTGIACYDLNRNYIGIEKDIDIYNVAKKRVEKNILLRANKPKTLFNDKP